MPNSQQVSQEERVIAVVKATCLVCIDGRGRLQSREAVVTLVGAIATFAGCTADPSDALLSAIAGLEEARRILASKPAPPAAAVSL